LVAHFKSLGSGLPIRGGWGYSQDDACIIDKNDELVDPSMPFDGVSIEYIFVEKRIYEELIICRPNGQKFSGIRWELIDQTLIRGAEETARFSPKGSPSICMANAARQVPDQSSAVYDVLRFAITAFPEKDWNELKAEYEGPQGYGHPNFDAELHESRRRQKMIHLKREFWFEISSFFGVQ
jgi:hypothetical protein